MEFSAFLIFAVWTSSMTYLTFGKERERMMVFPDYYFYAERRLVKHTIQKRYVKNLDDCELFCYLNDNCVSLNFKKDPDNNEQVHICEVNNATHLKYDSDLTTDYNFYYRGSMNACDKSSNCQNNATCQSGFTLKGYKCLCPPGFEGEHCEKDIDECKGNHSCHVNARCLNTIGSHVCECHPGYTGNGRNCTDIDECKTYPGKCHVNATCNNTQGSHVCTCKPGYTGDGRNCTDVDECSEARTVKINKCHPNASCINTEGSFNCSCKTNYVGDGFNCEADPCNSYKELSDANRRSDYITPPHGTMLCDRDLDGWYRFVGAAGTKMPSMRVQVNRCGTTWSGWLDGAHPTEEDGEVYRKVCFSGRPTGCKFFENIPVKNCGSYFIYKLRQPPGCESRYCGTD